MACRSARGGADRPPPLELLSPGHLAGHDETEERWEGEKIEGVNTSLFSFKIYIIDGLVENTSG